ncbi:MAG: hypothetical protein GX880_06280, partial [Methanomicrobiales archaeon]|nr:hypothetical protein [Methanomicrobiales archaeon]
DAETHEDVDDLVSFLDGMLARFGRGDPATAERVDAYRRRVLALRPTKPEAQAPRVETVASMAPVPAGPGSVQQNIEGTSPAPHAIEAAVPPAPKQPEPVSKPIAGTPKQPEPTPVSKPIAGAPKQPEPGPAGAKPPAAGEGEVCETCGAEVTKSQAKLSNLFMNKTLCKKCMEQP